MEFPFDLVFDHFARPLDGKVVPEDSWAPKLYLVFVAGGAIDHVEALPAAPLFESNWGKTALGATIRRFLAGLPLHACLVLTSEAWAKTVQVAPGVPPRDRSKGLEHDPEAQEVLVFQIYHRSGVQNGLLPIGPGRVVTYQPLELEQISAGRLSLRPGGDLEKETLDAQAMAEAAVKRAADKV